jgi:phasin
MAPRKPTTKPEAPQDVREIALQNISQAQEAYNQLLEAARQGQEVMKKFLPSNPVVEGLTEAQERALRFTEQNLNASFDLANELAKARDLNEVLQIQSRHAQLQMHAFALQAQELASLVNAAAKKAKP